MVDQKTLFEAAQKDHSRPYELKQELNRLDLFREDEDLFLDLFKDPEEEGLAATTLLSDAINRFAAIFAFGVCDSQE